LLYLNKLLALVRFWEAADTASPDCPTGVDGVGGNRPGDALGSGWLASALSLLLNPNRRNMGRPSAGAVTQLAQRQNKVAVVRTMNAAR